MQPRELQVWVSALVAQLVRAAVSPEISPSGGMGISEPPQLVYRKMYTRRDISDT